MNQISIILVHAGTSQLPSYLRETFEITRRIGKKSRIVFLANEANFNDFQNLITRPNSNGEILDIEFVAIESIPRGEPTQKFQEISALDRSFRSGFWFNASNRFLVLADYMSHAGLEYVIHIENDYVLYFDPTDKLDAFSLFADFAVPLDRIRAIPGIVWLKDSRVANSLAKHISDNPNQDDMATVGQFCVKDNEFRARPLPTLPFAYASKKGLDINKYSQGIDLFGGVFDAAAIGQYIGGIHWMNNPADTTFFINESSDLNLNDFSFSWGVKDGIKSPHLNFQDEITPVLGVHAHSKNLWGISPFNHGVPESEINIITGERLQALCEITLGAPSITKFHGKSNIESKELIEISEDANGNLEPPTVELIERVSRAKSIFVYTHLIPYFKYYLAPRMNAPFTLVTHNSDYSVTVNDFQLLNHPHLKNWFAQNCEFSHTKLKPLPIGLENKQWGSEKISQIVEAGKSMVKTKLLYSNFSAQTHPSRMEAMMAIKELKDITIESGVQYEDYLESLGQHKFCICPRGNGIDTHRFWEAQYLDCIPIVLWRDWSSAYSEMPILILDNWAELKELDLDKIYITLANKQYSRSGLDLRKLAKQIQHD